MHIKTLILILILILMLTACQTESMIIFKGSSEKTTSYTSSGWCPSRQHTCWQSPLSGSTQQTTFILAASANVGDLTKTHQDAQQFQQAMQERFPNNQVCLLENVCRAEFEQALTDLTPLVKSTNRVIIFFSGHGSQVKDNDGDERDSQDEVLVTVDVTDLERPDRQDVVTDDRLVELVDDWSTEQVITFIDACLSGGMNKSRNSPVRNKYFFGGALGTIPRPLMAAEMVRQANGLQHLKGVILTASQEYESAGENEEGGIFTTNFLKQLTLHPQASLAEVFDYTQAEVPQLNPVQHPRLMGNRALLEN